MVGEILEREERRAQRLARAVWDWTRSIVVAFLLFIVVRTFLIEAFKIPTSSMEGTLLVGDFLLVNKAVYGAELPGTSLRLPAFAEPHRGDVVVFQPPHETGKSYVKRLVGEPGDTLSMRDKVLHLNGAPLDEPYTRFLDFDGDAMHPRMSWQSNHLIANTMRAYRPTRDNWGPIVVPPGHYFMLGDNRDNSEDSRYWGFVQREAIRGRPWFVYYSFDASENDDLPWIRHVRWRRIGSRIR
jgi:signal peptidase I